MPHASRGRITRSRAAILALGAIGAGLLFVPSTQAAEPFVAGSGRAEARVLRVGPAAGRLSLAPVLGVALADYLNTVGRAEARLFDFAALDDSVPDELKDEFPSARAQSTDDPPSSEATVAGTPSGAPATVGTVRQQASASRSPQGRSSVRFGALDIPGLISMSGGVAESTAGVVAAGQREAMGRTRIDRLVLGGGAVELTGLTWEAVQRTGKLGAVKSTFTVEGAVIGGQAVAVPTNTSAVKPFLDLVNSTLEASVGLRLGLPESENAAGIAVIGPLAVTVADSPAGHATLAPLVAGLQPVKDPIAGAIFDNAPDAAGLVLVADVLIGAVSGAGSFNLELGGARAFTEGEVFDNPFAFDPPRPSTDSFDLPPVGNDDRSFEPAAFDAAADGPALPALDPSPGVAALGGPTTRTDILRGTRGGAAAAVGLAALLAALGLAAADYRRMRTARRTIVPPTPSAGP